MKGFIVTLTLVFLFPFVSGQSKYELSHQVLVPAAGIIAVGGISYQQTAGETAVEIFVFSPNTLTQGFQQPRYVPPLVLPPREGNGVDFFPNPLTEVNYYVLNVRLYGILARSYNVMITNLIGTVIYQDEVELSPDHDYVFQVDMRPYANGIYIITVRSSDDVIDRSFKIDKV